MDEMTRVINKIASFQNYTFFRCNRPEIKVACILDTFSYDCFKYEATLEQLRIDTWRQQIENIKPDFLFVESAWRGVDDTWRNVLINKANASKKELFDLIIYCKNNKIKTVFWNKEDPINYLHFIGTAKMFDFIFTTDEDCVENYVRDVGHNRVCVLPFAAQPAIHNPVNSSYKDKENVAFAGTWYVAKHLERQADMRVVLTPAQEFELHIFDRMHTFTGNGNYRFPAEYQGHIIGALTYTDMTKAYKLYKVFLNVNSVRNSRTMFSRRVFEILASGTNVVSTYSKGMENMLGNLVRFSSSQKETKEHLSTLLRDPEYSQRLSLLGIRAVHAEHTYKHRFNTILEKIGLESLSYSTPGVSMVVCLNDGQSLESVLESYKKQTWMAKELLIMVKQDEDESTNLWEEISAAYPDVAIYSMLEDKTPGDYLNFAVEKAKYEYIAILGEKDDYAPHFILDLMNAFNYTDADIVGKSCYYVYFEKSKILVLKNYAQENRFADDIADSAVIMKKSVFDSVRFPSTSGGVCQEILVQCAEKGFKIFSADKYNYVHKVNDFGQVESSDRLISDVNDYKHYTTI